MAPTLKVLSRKEVNGGEISGVALQILSLCHCLETFGTICQLLEANLWTRLTERVCPAFTLLPSTTKMDWINMEINFCGFSCTSGIGNIFWKWSERPHLPQKPFVGSLPSVVFCFVFFPPLISGMMIIVENGCCYLTELRTVANKKRTLATRPTTFCKRRRRFCQHLPLWAKEWICKLFKRTTVCDKQNCDHVSNLSWTLTKPDNVRIFTPPLPRNETRP